AVLEQFLPKQLSEAEIRVLISDFLDVGETRPNMGEVMKHMKTHYDGQYDGKVVSKIAAELLK
ncbi:GatB/YqeY domain-containing protein, partial [Escherichia coli]|uniref:GatB/YqeY domain-containing protein n=1 Tax=Escherichia coli TaxID=562 RepID=UPI00200EB9DA